jgi:hypothetical protein
MTNIEKEAQAKKLRHKARRGVNLTGKALEALNSEYRKVVGDMNKLDEEIRRDAENLKIIAGEARSLSRRRDYFAAASAVSQFHEKLKIINARLNNFSLDLKRNHQRFLLKNLSTLDAKRLMEYDPNKEVKFDENRQLVREAGAISDWWHNIFTQKGKAMRALENKFSTSFITDLKQATTDIVKQTEDMFAFMDEIFNELGWAWGARNVGEYSAISQKLSDRYRDYHRAYLAYHNKYVLPLQEERRKLEEEERQEAEKAKAQQVLTETPSSTPTIPRSSPPTLEMPPPPAPDTEKTLTAPPSSPTVPDLEEEAFLLPQEKKKAPPFPEDTGSWQYGPEGYRRKSHQEFIGRLEKLGTTTEITQEILNYSEQLEESDPNESLKLLSIAEGMIAEKTTASFDEPPDEPLPGMPPSLAPLKKKDPNKPSEEDEEVEAYDPALSPPDNPYLPVEHNIPKGLINELWANVPFLKQISHIAISPETRRRNITIINNVLRRKGLPVIRFEIGHAHEEEALTQAIKNAIPKGLLMSNMQCSDRHNPNDCELLVGCYFKLSQINPTYRGTVRFIVPCRLNIEHKAISTKSIKSIEVV